MDPRLNSVHLDFCPRREEYRAARGALLERRGWITWAAEQVHDALPDAAEWLPLVPAKLLQESERLLFDRETGATYPLVIGLNTIGRFPNNDIVFEDLDVSRRHCVILVHADGRCELHDTASRNGTYVNGRRVQHPIGLRCGDLIRVSKKQVYFATAEESVEMLGVPDTIATSSD
jgi:hypothetical protein